MMTTRWCWWGDLFCWEICVNFAGVYALHLGNIYQRLIFCLGGEELCGSATPGRMICESNIFLPNRFLIYEIL